MKQLSHGASRPILQMPELILHTLTMDFYKLPDGRVQQIQTGEKPKFITQAEFINIKAVFGR